VPCFHFHFHLFFFPLDSWGLKNGAVRLYCLRGIGRTDDNELGSVCFGFRSRIRAFADFQTLQFLAEKTTTCFLMEFISS
jgi:hypothetical protein